MVIMAYLGIVLLSVTLILTLFNFTSVFTSEKWDKNEKMKLKLVHKGVIMIKNVCRFRDDV
jgi:hypothetical protein